MCHRTFPSVASYNQMSRAAVEILIQVQIKFSMQNSAFYFTLQFVICKMYVPALSEIQSCAMSLMDIVL